MKKFAMILPVGVFAVFFLVPLFVSPDPHLLYAEENEPTKDYSGEWYLYGGICKLEDGLDKIDGNNRIRSTIEEDGSIYGLRLVKNLHPHFGLQFDIEGATNEHYVYMTVTDYENEIISENVGKPLLFLKANIIINLLTGRFVPYIFGGGGGYTEFFDDISPCLNYGAGIKINPFKNIVFRIDYNISKVRYKYNIGEVDLCSSWGDSRSGLCEAKYDYSEDLTFKNITAGIGFLF